MESSVPEVGYIVIQNFGFKPSLSVVRPEVLTINSKQKHDDVGASSPSSTKSPARTQAKHRKVAPSTSKLNTQTQAKHERVASPTPGLSANRRITQTQAKLQGWTPWGSKGHWVGLLGCRLLGWVGSELHWHMPNRTFSSFSRREVHHWCSLVSESYLFLYQLYQLFCVSTIHCVLSNLPVLSYLGFSISAN